MTSQSITLALPQVANHFYDLKVSIGLEKIAKAFNKSEIRHKQNLLDRIQSNYRELQISEEKVVKILENVIEKHQKRQIK